MYKFLTIGAGMNKFLTIALTTGAGTMASWLVRSTLDQVLQVQALCSLCSHSASLHPGIGMGTSKFNAGG